ncbi:CDP-glycerol glycerophosphotransferase family protein [Methanogenium organophilum]|uniref:CDP-glycerol glycerophosphotransferase family protein n=1 Tax=Methanogenium organophilum TaxID=2199 RepID=A0A9X9S362_METOG|nr:CDP-glycerol glycerophosphotransferase family protein [Methanogenium organophilum]WAI00841.1 CDP-glycerol glycerophosphotransferase family protein [Methanogenium organophilum]
MNKKDLNAMQITPAINYALKLFTYPLSLIIPKNSKILVIGGWFGERFADNSRYLYEFLSINKEKYDFEKVIWVTRNKKIIQELENKNFEVYHIWSLKSIWYHLRSPIFIYDQSINDLNSFFLHKGVLLYLWHGFPLKKIGTFAMSDEYKKKSRCNIKIFQTLECILPGVKIRYGGKGSYLLAQSEFASNVLSEAFSIPKDRVILAGYPRNDIFDQKEPEVYYIGNDFELIKKIQDLKNLGYKIIFYAPTFRDKAPTNFFGTEDLSEIQKLKTFLLNKNYALITKFHFATNTMGQILENDSHFFNLDSDTDVYSVLPFIDILITDYSSIAFDFLFLNRPIIYFPYDLEYYRDEDRGFMFDFEEFTPGPKVYNIDELTKILEEIYQGVFIDHFSDERKKLSEKIYDPKYYPGSHILATEINKILRTYS